MKIIRLVLVLTVWSTLSNVASAQLTIGAKGGINLNSFRGEETYDVVPGFNGGAFVRYPIFRFLNARAEVLYMQQGANLIDYRVFGSELNRSRVRVAFHNVSVPLLAEFGLSSLAEDNLQPKLLLGGVYSYTVYARESYNNNVSIGGYGRVTYDGYSDFTPLINREQYGLIAGIAADVKVKSIPVSIEFRYQYNMNRVNKPGTQNLYNLELTHDLWGDDLNLSTLSINLGVTLIHF